MTVPNVLRSFVQTFELYCLFRGVCGYFLGGNVTVSYVLYYELIGTSRYGLFLFLLYLVSI